MKNKKLTKKDKEILFSDFPKSINFCRNTIEKFSKKYCTQEEMKKRAQKAFSVKL